MGIFGGRLVKKFQLFKISDIFILYVLKHKGQWKKAENTLFIEFFFFKNQGPVVQSIICLTSSLSVISLTVLADSIYNILIFFAEIM